MSGPVPAWRRQGYSIDAMRDLARAALPRPIFDFADGAAEDEHTLRRNEKAFDGVSRVEDIGRDLLFHHMQKGPSA